MAKMAPLGPSPATAEDNAEAAPGGVSTASIHADDMGKMGMEPGAPGGHVEGMVHGVIEHSHEHGMTMKLTHGALKHMSGKSHAEKMYGGKKGGGEGKY